MALNELATYQSAPTEQKNRKITMLLNHLSTHPIAKCRYTKWYMILYSHSECGVVYTNHKSLLTNLNGPIHIECKILKYVVASAAEAETAGLFHNY